MNTIQLIQSAIRATSPIVGIPQEGGKPFCVRRSLLKESLKGMEIIEAAIQLPLDSDSGIPYLQVYAVAEKVTGIRKFLPLNPHVVNRELREWAEKQREARQKSAATPAPPANKYEKHIARLEREIKKVGDLKPPFNYLLMEGREYQPTLEAGRVWAKWKREARLRNRLWHLANKGFHGKPQTSRVLYDEARKLGVEPKLYSKFTKNELERLKIKGLPDYLLTFHEHCGLTRKPEYQFRPMKWTDYDGKSLIGANRYEGWLARVRNVKQLRNEIESIRLEAVAH